MEWRLALLVLVVVPVLLGVLTVYSGRTARPRGGTEGRRARSPRDSRSRSPGIHLVQMYAREDDEDERLRDMNQQSLRAASRPTGWAPGSTASSSSVLGAATAATLFFGAPR